MVEKMVRMGRTILVMYAHPSHTPHPPTRHTHTRKDAKSVKVKKANNVTKFKIRCSRVRFGFEVSDRDP